jgi:GYF domain 2/Short C-terminal domain/Bacterial PH domain
MNYYYFTGGTEVVGPYALDEIIALVTSGKLPPTTQICAEGSETWQPVTEHLSSEAPPPLPKALGAPPQSKYREIGGTIRNRAALDHISKTVESDERIIATLKGIGEETSIGALFGKQAGAALGGDYVLVTDRKVVIIKTGVGTFATGALGLKTKSYIYESISSVAVSRGLLFGEIEIVSSGMVEKGSGGFFSGASKDSVVQFEKKYFDEAQQLAMEIRQMAHAARQNQHTGQKAESLADQIQKLSELHRTGILSADEFTEAKKRLLGKTDRA